MRIEIVVITFYSGINDFIKDSTLIHLFRLSFSTINIKHFNKLSSPELVWSISSAPALIQSHAASKIFLDLHPNLYHFDLCYKQQKVINLLWLFPQVLCMSLACIYLLLQWCLNGTMAGVKLKTSRDATLFEVLWCASECFTLHGVASICIVALNVLISLWKRFECGRVKYFVFCNLFRYSLLKIYYEIVDEC